MFLCACDDVQNRQRPAVPKFGVWDEQTAASAGQGFTVVFENVKRNREVARSAMPAVPRVPSPPEGAALRRHHQKTPFVSKVRVRSVITSTTALTRQRVPSIRWYGMSFH